MVFPEYIPSIQQELAADAEAALNATLGLMLWSGGTVAEVADTTIHNVEATLDDASGQLDVAADEAITNVVDRFNDAMLGDSGRVEADLDAAYLSTEDFEAYMAEYGTGAVDTGGGLLEDLLKLVYDPLDELLRQADELLPVLDPVSAAILEGIGAAVGKIAGEFTVAFLEVTIPMAAKFIEGVFEGLATVDIDTDKFKQSFKDMSNAMKEAMTELGAELQ